MVALSIDSSTYIRLRLVFDLQFPRPVATRRLPAPVRAPPLVIREHSDVDKERRMRHWNAGVGLLKASSRRKSTSSWNLLAGKPY